jgi:uncharacterized protein YaiL (DUF2058 family)
MRNPLQDQLLKAGLVKKDKVDAAARALERQRDGKAAKAEQVDAQRLLAERAERDRALSAERNAQARAKEIQAQVRQIVDAHRIPFAGEQAYRFTDGDKIKEVWVTEALRKQLAKGALVIVRHDPGYALLPRSAAEMIYARGGSVVLDHAKPAAPPEPGSDEDYYSKFAVPDDLIW